MAAPTNQESLDSLKQALKDLSDAGVPASVTVATAAGTYTYTNQTLPDLLEAINQYEAKVAAENGARARTYATFTNRPL